MKDSVSAFLHIQSLTSEADSPFDNPLTFASAGMLSLSKGRSKPRLFSDNDPSGDVSSLSLVESPRMMRMRSASDAEPWREVVVGVEF